MTVVGKEIVWTALGILLVQDLDWIASAGMRAGALRKCCVGASGGNQRASRSGACCIRSG
jgi:hypothetical protein